MFQLNLHPKPKTAWLQKVLFSTLASLGMLPLTAHTLSTQKAVNTDLLHKFRSVSVPKAIYQAIPLPLAKQCLSLAEMSIESQLPLLDLHQLFGNIINSDVHSVSGIRPRLKVHCPLGPKGGLFFQIGFDTSPANALYLLSRLFTSCRDLTVRLCPFSSRVNVGSGSIPLKDHFYEKCASELVFGGVLPLPSKHFSDSTRLSVHCRWSQSQYPRDYSFWGKTQKYWVEGGVNYLNLDHAFWCLGVAVSVPQSHYRLRLSSKPLNWQAHVEFDPGWPFGFRGKLLYNYQAQVIRMQDTVERSHWLSPSLSINLFKSYGVALEGGFRICLNHKTTGWRDLGRVFGMLQLHATPQGFKPAITCRTKKWLRNPLITPTFHLAQELQPEYAYVPPEVEKQRAEAWQAYLEEYYLEDFIWDEEDEEDEEDEVVNGSVWIYSSDRHVKSSMDLYSTGEALPKSQTYSQSAFSLASQDDSATL